MSETIHTTNQTRDDCSEQGGAQPSDEEDRPQLRLALALNGGVSLAVWIGGVANEILRLCRRSDPTYRCLVDCLGLEVRADVLAGASAGGINAVFLALGLLYDHDDLAPLRDLWVRSGDFDLLFRDPLDSQAPSLMRGDDFFLPKLREAIEKLMGTEQIPSPAADVDVQLTVTSMTGEVEFRSDDLGAVLSELRHDALITFQNSRGDFIRSGGNVERLARACRSTASFPAAFEPSFVRVREPFERELSVVPPANEDEGNKDDGAFRNGLDIERVSEDRYLIDGGVLVNLPVDATIQAIFSKYARGEVRRICAMVVPDPFSEKEPPPDQRNSSPDLLSVVGASASGLPRTQLIGRFLDDLSSHNYTVRILRHQRLALLAQAGSTEGLVALAKGLFNAYRAGRLEAIRCQAVEELADAIRTHDGLATVSLDWRNAIRRAFENPSFAPRWIPASDDFLVPDDWGSSIIQRTYGRLLHILYQVPAGPASVAKIKNDLYVAWQRADGIDRKEGARILGDALPGGTLDELIEFIRRRAREWPQNAVDLATIATALKEMAASAEEIGDLASGSLVTDIGSNASLGALPSHGEGLRFVLALEVIECAFGDFDKMIEQLVQIAQIDSLQPAAIDKRGRPAHEKVAGIQLGHFGGFLKRSWRANDWMWGRLDAATQLCRILIMHEGAQSRHPDLAEAVGLTESASPEEIAKRWSYKVQQGILVEELPEVAEAVRADLASGALAGTPSSNFLAAYDRKTGPTRAELTQESAIELLEMAGIGGERLADELGSDLVTRTSMHAFATASTVIQRGSPAVLRSAVVAIRYVALVAWALTRTASSRSRLLNTFGGLLIGGGFVGVLLDLFTPAALGLFALPVWVAFGVGILLAFARAPYVVVPTIVLALLPRLYLALPTDRWFWVPDAWPWPGAHRGPWKWISVAGFIVASLVIGLVRRPAWLTGFHRRVQERTAALDAKLAVPSSQALDAPTLTVPSDR